MKAYHNDVVWNDTPWAALESLHHDEVCDVCVIGLGGSGLHAIEYLVSYGRSVIGIDAGMVGNGAAGSNGGFILAGIASFHHDAVVSLGRTHATQLYLDTLGEIARLRACEPSFRQVGSLRIAIDESEYADCVAQYTQMHADGLPVEWYDGREGKGLLFPFDGSFQPLARVRRMTRECMQAGAKLYERTAATHIGSGRVIANGYTIQCNHIIVAVDGHLERLIPQLAPRVKTARLQMIATKPDHTIDIPRPVYSRYGYDYWQQLPDKSIAIGGSRDRFESEEWGHDARPTQTVQADIEHTLRTVVGSNAPISHRWGATVAYRTDDIRPIVAQIPPNTWVCGAYNGTGNLVGTLCARLIAEAILTGHTTHMHGWLTE